MKRLSKLLPLAVNIALPLLHSLLSNINRNRTRECDFKRFGGRRRLLFEYHPPRWDPVEVPCNCQQKQIKQKAAKIAKGLGTNCASTECKTKFSQDQ